MVPLEIAASYRARSRGLLDRTGITEALLLSPASGVHTFRMRFAIDVAYLDRELTVIGVRTMRPGRLGLPRPRARHVLEAEAGAMERWGAASRGAREHRVVCWSRHPCDGWWLVSLTRTHPSGCGEARAMHFQLVACAQCVSDCRPPMPELKPFEAMRPLRFYFVSLGRGGRPARRRPLRGTGQTAASGPRRRRGVRRSRAGS